MTAFVMFTVGDQPVIVPPSPAKMNTLAPLRPPCVTTNDADPLKTIPVGLAGPAPPALGQCRAPRSRFNRGRSDLEEDDGAEHQRCAPAAVDRRVRAAGRGARGSDMKVPAAEGDADADIRVEARLRRVSRRA